jgi:enamine deaminase RidA (YjgF/YER057c/UK114 family)
MSSTDRQEYLDGTEIRPGYCRALRVGNAIFISGTGALDTNGKLVGPSVGEQARFIYKKIETSLAHFGADMSHLVRILIFLTDVKDFDEFNKVHEEVFAKYRPSSDLVIVADLVKGMSVQIEAQAII